MGMPMQGQAFLSYCSKDRRSPEFEALLDDLVSLQRPFWYDQRIKGGQQWWSEIVARIVVSPLVIATVTHRAITSPACLTEWDLAAQARRPMVAVALERVAPTELPPVISRTHVVDYSQRCAGTVDAPRCMASLEKGIGDLARRGVPPPPSGLVPPPPPAAYGDTMRRYLKAVDLPIPAQREMVREAERLVNDDEDDRRLLRDILEKLADREEVGWTVRGELEELIRRLSLSDRQTTPEERRSATARVGGTAGDKGQTRRLNVSSLDLYRLALSLHGWFASNRMEAQIVEGGERNTMIVQARSAKNVRLVGAGAALTTILSLSGDVLEVTVTGAEWKDKGAALGGAVSLAVATSGTLLPLVGVAAVGAYKQVRLPRKIFAYIEQMAPLCRRG